MNIYALFSLSNIIFQTFHVGLCY